MCFRSSLSLQDACNRHLPCPLLLLPQALSRPRNRPLSLCLCVWGGGGGVVCFFWWGVVVGCGGGGGGGVNASFLFGLTLSTSESASESVGEWGLAFTRCEVDALGVMTISRACFERCCSNKTTLAYHSNFSFVALRNRRPTLLRAPAYRTLSEASPRRRCGHASRFHFEAFVHESIIHLLPPPTCIARTMQCYCTSIPQYTTPPRPPPFCMPYTIQYWQ